MGPPTERSAAPVVVIITERPWAALGLAVGPAAFIAAWAVGGATTADYSPIDDAISRIAAVGAPRRAVMNVGFVVYGVSVLVGSAALHCSPLRRVAPLAALNSVATLAVALTPLERSEAVDTAHGVAATIGYVSLAALPLASAPILARHGLRRAAAGSVVAGTGAAVCLAATTVSDANGLFQRVGLGFGDVWLITAGLALWAAGRRHLAR